MPGIDDELIKRNRIIEAQLLEAAERYHRKQDFRWFFTYAHAKITEQINRNIDLFERPNDLIRLNIHFAETFLQAINGRPHTQWRRAFDACNISSIARNFMITAPLDVEFCGADMARVHIFEDLSAALREVGCISPNDYGNMLVFVNRGAMLANIRLRGSFLGVIQTSFVYMMDDWFNMNVKVWRNSVYENVCRVPVPEINPDFSRRIHLP